MRYVLLFILAFVSNDPREVAKINALKQEAEEAFLNGNYEVAISKYSMLYDSLGVEEDEILLNLGHAHYQLSDTASAKSRYNSLSTSTDRSLKSIAYQQLGVMSKDAQKLEQALQQLKAAIKADPFNDQARYNYEVVKKQLEEQKNQEQQQQQQDQQNQDGENEEQENKQENGEEKKEDQEGEPQESDKDQEGEEQENEEQKEGEQSEQEQEKSQEQMTKEKLQEMNISEEKAKMILEAMKNNEIQYLQQQKRKATERPPSDKPDW